MVNINMTHFFKHPKFYRIPRDKSDQAISKRQPTGESERASWSGPQAASNKLQAASNKPKGRDCLDGKTQDVPAASSKLQDLPPKSQ